MPNITQIPTKPSPGAPASRLHLIQSATKTSGIHAASAKTLSNILLPCILALVLTGCSGGDQMTSGGSAGETKSENVDEKSSEAAGDDPDEILEADSDTGKQGKSTAKKRKHYSTEGKATGVTAPGVLVQQENEVLGLNLVKLCKFGVRMDSPSITVVMRPGETPVAYNSQNGLSLLLTEKAASYMAGVKSDKAHGELKVVQMGNENLCNKPCIHYRLIKILRNTKKEFYDSWAEDVWMTKDVKVAPNILNELSKMVLMPPNLGFPVRIARFKGRDTEHCSTDLKRLEKLDMKMTKNIVRTLSFDELKLDKGDFVLLEGFKPAKDEMQFMMGSDESEVANGSELDDLEDSPAAGAADAKLN